MESRAEERVRSSVNMTSRLDLITREVGAEQSRDREREREKCGEREMKTERSVSTAETVGLAGG